MTILYDNHLYIGEYPFGDQWLYHGFTTPYDLVVRIIPGPEPVVQYPQEIVYVPVQPIPQPPATVAEPSAFLPLLLVLVIGVIWYRLSPTSPRR